MKPDGPARRGTTTQSVTSLSYNIKSPKVSNYDNVLSFCQQLCFGIKSDNLKIALCCLTKSVTKVIQFWSKWCLLIGSLSGLLDPLSFYKLYLLWIDPKYREI